MQELVQRDFSGGMNCMEPGPTQFKDGLNLMIRGGRPRVRGGCRRALKAFASFESGFYFNTDNVRYNDGQHTGFWFAGYYGGGYQPIVFVSRVTGGAVQGAQLVKLEGYEQARVITCSEGAVYIHEHGYATEINAAGLGDTEDVEFCQAQNKVFLLRGSELTPMMWDGESAQGFIGVGEHVAPDDEDMPMLDGAVYFLGRLWGWRGTASEVWASAVLEFTDWNSVSRTLEITPGDGDEIVALVPFHQDTLLVFKTKSVHALGGVNAVIEANTNLADYCFVRPVDLQTGALGRHAWVVVGEDVWYLGYGGIYSLSRNQENNLERQPVAQSVPVQTWIERINWRAAGTSCATMHDNYVIFAVPVDGAETPNCLLVYDALMRAWCGAWRGPTLRPLRFFRDDQDLLMLCDDGAVRELMTGDPWDSEHYEDDAREWAAATVYEPGDVVKVTENGMATLYRALQTSLNESPAAGTIWEELDDPAEGFHVASRLEMRVFDAEGPAPLRFGKVDVWVREAWARASVKALDPVDGEERELTTKEWDRAAWDVADQTEFDDQDEELLGDEPHRQDYTLIFDETDGVYIGPAGRYMGRRVTHALRAVAAGVMPRSRSLALAIESTRGQMEIRQVALQAEALRVGTRE